MRKTFLYIIILAVLGFGVYFFLFSEGGNVFGDKEANFTFRDTGRIGKIFLADRKGNTIKLERTPNGWMVNDRYPVLKSNLDGLLTTMYKQETQYPAPTTMHNTVVKDLATVGIKVEVYDREGEKWRTFFVGGAAPNMSGTFMLMEGAEKPYVVQVPGFEGYVTPRYATDITEWRDRAVFNIKPEAIESISVTYPTEPLNSFTLTKENDQFAVSADTAIESGRPYNKERANSYAGFFTNVNMEGYLTGAKGIDTVLKKTPVLSIVEVKDTAGKNYKAIIYPMPLNKRSKNQIQLEGMPEERYDADRMYAVLNNGKDTVIIQTMTFDKIFRKAYEFFEQNPLLNKK